MGFDRTPPQDLAAEQCVLGAMMLSKDAIADVIETLRGTDFYRPAHEIVFDAVTDLYARGEPADAITVAAELNRVARWPASAARRTCTPWSPPSRSRRTRVLRAHRPGEGDPAPPGRGRHQDRPARVRRRG
jgi:hypothetical protein